MLVKKLKGKVVFVNFRFNIAVLFAFECVAICQAGNKILSGGRTFK